MAQQQPFSSRFGDFDFAVKVTIGDGTVEWGIWRGDMAKGPQNAVYYIEGEALARCLEADPFASAGEVIMTQAVYEQLPAGTVTELQIDSYRQLTGLSHELLAVCPPLPLADKAVDESLASAFFPIDLLHLPIQGEFRQVVTLFINLQSLPADEFFPSTLFRLLNQYGGYLCRAGRIGDRDKGGTLLLFWGAPHSRENDVVRALHFILDLQATVTTPLKAGITTGMAYAGFIGSPRREEYTCHGIYVNLAARLMVEAGWGAIWLDEETSRRAKRAFDLVSLGDHRFKGFAEKRPVFSLKAWREAGRDSFYRGPLVGREQELAQLQSAVQPLDKGHFGGVLTISGEAGIGKSRLVHEFLKTSEVFKTSEIFLCQTDEILRQSLNPFRYFLRRYFDQSPAASEVANKRRFNQKVDDLITATRDADVQAELQRTRSFLGALVDLHWPDSLYAHLEPKLRFENTLVAVKALIKAESRRRPVIIHLEDAHWLDADSRAFLAGLTRNVAGYPFLIIATTRPPQTAGVETTLPVPEEMPQTTIHLAPLPPAALEALATDRLDGPVAPGLVNLLAERAEGNPFFAEQILLYLQEQALISRNGRGWELKNGARPNGSLPADVRSLLVARLDRLPPDVRQVVQAASVLGREFAIQVLNQMLFEDKALMDKVKAAVAAAIWAALTEARYLFHHTLLRDAAYEMQLRARRQALHRMAAESLETLYADELAPHYGEIGYHYEMAQIDQKAAAYYRQAGDVAKANYQNQDAIDLYTRAIRLTPKENHEMLYTLHLQRAEIYHLRGERELEETDIVHIRNLALALRNTEKRAEVALYEARYANAISDASAAAIAAQNAFRLAEAARDLQQQAKATMEWGRALHAQSAYAAAIDHFERAGQLAHTIGAEALVAESMTLLGTAYHAQGRYDEARSVISQALGQFRELGIHERIGYCLEQLAHAATRQSDYVEATAHLHEALALSEKTGARLTQAGTLATLGVIAYNQGNYAEAQKNFERALSIDREIGNVRGMTALIDNLGNVAAQQQQYGVARTRYGEALALARQLDDKRRIAMCLVHLGALAIEEGYPMGALAPLEEGAQLFLEIGAGFFAADALGALAEAHLALGNFAEAEPLVAQALQLNTDLNTDHGKNQVRLVQTAPWRQTGRLDEALDVAREALRYFESASERHGQLAAWMELGVLYELLDRLLEAEEAYRRALSLQQELGQPQWAQRGLASVALAQRDLVRAQQHVGVILDQNLLASLTEEEAVMAALTSYQVLMRTDDARAHDILYSAYALLQERAAKIPDEATRRSFLENVAVHRQIVAEWEQLH